MVSYLVSYPRFPHPGIHLGIHTGFIPVLCRFHILVSYLRFHTGFIRRFHTRFHPPGFIPVSYRTADDCGSVPLNNY
eukprot:8635835-Heterocapsa_arctica.AAC.1